MLPILSLLTPRLMIVAAIAIALAGSHWSAYRQGKEAVHTEWQADTAQRTAAALLESERNRAKEQTLQTAVRKVTNDYQAQKTRAAAADQRAADSLRQLTAALGADRAPGADPATPGGADDDPRSGIVAECAAALVDLDKAARRLASQAAALQDYTAGVCVAGK